MAGATLAVPPYVRVFYAPFMFISLPALWWSGFTGSIMGSGLQLFSAVHEPEGEDAAAAVATAHPAQPAPAPDFDIFAREHAVKRGALAGFLIATGLYLALPGGARVVMVYR